ncbi:hypothetical protein E2562_036347 [Oryza meyeriana var. granulata]|uniref:Retroviral polymerase SH3-like domain-containing protein n=1 Tax=Oryza meyeriana var. granulata TaxID=110450 RepID=A0A6G1C9N5_9ORYZ|nr:hypothetical protein E2562_036347 [Oryza meyeriana var. granulata]
MGRDPPSSHRLAELTGDPTRIAGRREEEARRERATTAQHQIVATLAIGPRIVDTPRRQLTWHVQDVRKLDDRNMPGVFIGYEEGMKVHCVLDPRT